MSHRDMSMSSLSRYPVAWRTCSYSTVGWWEWHGT